MTTDLRALCARMADELDRYRRILKDDRREVHPLATEARAALAEPQPEGPTDEELTLTYALAVAAAVDSMAEPWPADLCERAQLAGLRAVLARWGNQP